MSIILKRLKYITCQKEILNPKRHLASVADLTRRSEWRHCPSEAEVETLKNIFHQPRDKLHSILAPLTAFDPVLYEPRLDFQCMKYPRKWKCQLELNWPRSFKVVSIAPEPGLAEEYCYLQACDMFKNLGLLDRDGNVKDYKRELLAFHELFTLRIQDFHRTTLKLHTKRERFGTTFLWTCNLHMSWPLGVSTQGQGLSQMEAENHAAAQAFVKFKASGLLKSDSMLTRLMVLHLPEVTNSTTLPPHRAKSATSGAEIKPDYTICCDASLKGYGAYLISHHGKRRKNTLDRSNRDRGGNGAGTNNQDLSKRDTSHNGARTEDNPSKNHHLTGEATHKQDLMNVQCLSQCNDNSQGYLTHKFNTQEPRKVTDMKSDKFNNESNFNDKTSGRLFYENDPRGRSGADDTCDNISGDKDNIIQINDYNDNLMQMDDNLVQIIDKHMRMDNGMQMEDYRLKMNKNDIKANNDDDMQIYDIHMQLSDPMLEQTPHDEDPPREIAWFCSPWDSSMEWKNADSSFIEFYAVLCAVYTWKHHFQNKTVVVQTDNSLAHGVIENGLKLRTDGSQRIKKMFEVLCYTCHRYNIILQARHVSRWDNLAADALSRLHTDHFKALVPEAAKTMKKHKKLDFFPPLDNACRVQNDAS